MRFVYSSIAVALVNRIEATSSPSAGEVVTPGKPEDDIVIDVDEKQVDNHAAQPSPSYSDEGRISASSPMFMEASLPVVHQVDMPWIVEIPSYSERDGPITVPTPHSYTGATVNGKPHGRGVLTELSFPHSTMTGTFMDGLKHGEFHFHNPREIVHYHAAGNAICYLFDKAVACEDYRGVTVARVTDASVFMLESRYSDSDHPETFGQYFVEVECHYTGTVRFDMVDDGATPFVPHGFGTLVCAGESFTGYFVDGVRSGTFTHKYLGERVGSPMEYPTAI